jgi:hypothetical protein
LLASTLILAISAALFCYWFRYSCMLILSARPDVDLVQEFAAANRLTFPGNRDSIGMARCCELDSIRQSLDNDFTRIVALLKPAACRSLDAACVEQAILRLDYCLLRMWCRLATPVSARAARKALREMVLVIEHFAGSFARRSPVSSHA